MKKWNTPTLDELKINATADKKPINTNNASGDVSGNNGNHYGHDKPGNPHNPGDPFNPGRPR